MISLTVKNIATLLTIVLTLPLTPLQLNAAEPVEKIVHPKIQGATVKREANMLAIEPLPNTGSGDIRIPRFCGRIQEIHGTGVPASSTIQVSPGIKHWTFSWPNAQKTPTTILVAFDQKPQLLSELKPITEDGDGSVMLHASHATTVGEQLRYEPQTFKNTVGYWVNSDDYAYWRLLIDSPGEFNVGILQGCGAGHGGSTVGVSFADEQQEVASLEFEVRETGHFQNFHWRTIGTLKATKKGVYTLKVSAVHIKKGALMDVRAVHLIRLPKRTK